MRSTVTCTNLDVQCNFSFTCNWEQRRRVPFLQMSGNFYNLCQVSVSTPLEKDLTNKRDYY